MDDGKCEMDDVDKSNRINYAPSAVPFALVVKKTWKLINGGRNWLSVNLRNQREK
jgi:hypothetical protein